RAARGTSMHSLAHLHVVQAALNGRIRKRLRGEVGAKLVLARLCDESRGREIAQDATEESWLRLCSVCQFFQSQRRLARDERLEESNVTRGLDHGDFQSLREQLRQPTQPHSSDATQEALTPLNRRSIVSLDVSMASAA